MRVLAGLAVVVALATVHGLMQTGIAFTQSDQVLDCQYEGVAAHTHNGDCYDADGSLVCPLPERELHAHDESCYNDAGELTCGKEEVLETHVHGPGCFESVSYEGEAPSETYEPEVVTPEAVAPVELATEEAPVEVVPSAAQTLSYQFVDSNDSLVLRVNADVPEGALPEGSTMRAEWINAGDLSKREMAAVEKALAKKTEGKLTELQAVDVSFVDADGNEVEPAEKITVTLTSALVDTDDQPLVVHVDDLTEAQERALERGASEPKRKAEVVEALDDRELSQRDMSLASDQLAFESDAFSTYVLAVTTKDKQLVATDGESYTVTIDAPASAGVSQSSQLLAREFGEGDQTYDSCISMITEAQGAPRYVRLFDLSIVNEGQEVQPGAPVQVKMELDDAAALNEDVYAVHFGDAGMEIIDVNLDGDVVSFAAEGFSAYAIVEGPDPVPAGWVRLASMDDLSTYLSEGLYIGHTLGYYLADTEAVAQNGAHGIFKTKPASSLPSSAAAKYYFEPVEGTTNQYVIYCLVEGERRYIKNASEADTYLTADAAEATPFIVTAESNGRFSLQSTSTNRYLNHWQDANGTVFACWTAKNAGSYFYFWYCEDETAEDPYDLDGATYGLMNWNGAVSGKAMMADSSNANSLDALPLTVMANKEDDADKLFVPDNSDISLWTFHWIDGDRYYLTCDVGGTTKYLRVHTNGLTLVNTPDDFCKLQVVPGSGTHADEICLKSSNATLTYTGSAETGFKTRGAAGTEWLHLVELSELTPDYFMTYSATKVSVSDPEVTTGSRIIVYTRMWNDQTKKYELYAIDHDGSLVRCYESGDSIQWVGSRLNSLLWNFVEYKWEGTDNPNYYYELYNQYSEKYVAPQVTDGQILSDDTIGINLNGRRNGAYYSTILAWDDDNYAYAGYKIENGQIVSCPRSEAMDFYFATMEDIPVDDTLHTVKTLDSEKYGITMRMVNFDTRAEMSGFLGNDQYTNGNTKPNLLSTHLDENGYPTTNKAVYPNAQGDSLASWFADATVVNHLFIESIHNASGYFEYDSTQNFAHLNTSGENANTFTVYKEIGTTDGSGSSQHYKHGQFFPYNDLQAGTFASTNRQNLTTATGADLPDDDPRKYEQLYLVSKPDYYLGMEIEASFTQTPNGLDDWGHDIIYEFTGDDDFWLYVDGELVIDLGGIHDALPGSVNYRTGEVVVNGRQTTLRDVFYNNYKGRGHTDAEAQEYVDGIFEQNDDGNWVFKDYTTHHMKIFYFERGAGASNLHMRFNLASVRPGTVQLTKTLSGIDSTESVLAEFPYQIKYRTSDGLEHLLTNGFPGQVQREDHVFYEGTSTPVAFRPSLEIGGVTYDNVFLLRPKEIAEIEFPADIVDYTIVECGVDTNVYSAVSANNVPIVGTAGSGYAENREDYALGYETTNNRATVTYDNEVNPQAQRTVEITKKLYRENGVDEINTEEDPTTFNLRIYLATEFEQYLDDAVANMHTYHVKDNHGNYCKWDAAQKRLVPIRDGATDYDALTEAEKKSATFTTSTNGAISRIPAGYTVELREVLVGTSFKVVERPTEMPDGYSFQMYGYDGYTPGEGSLDDVAWAGVSDVVETDEDPHVDVRNLKGYGLRLNKTWSDEDYMAERDATYFAVYTDDGASNLTLVDGTVRQLAYGEKTLYWYFLSLPVEVPFDQYEIREVKLTDPVVNNEGVVTGYSAIQRLDEDDVLTLNGRQIGETTRSAFDYTVTYEKGEVDPYSNVRVDEATNSRPGIILKKQDWAGNALAGATFTLEDNAHNAIGTFTSDDDGLVTVAFLRKNVNYTLKETKTPRGYCGLESSMTIRQNDSGKVTVSGVDDDYFDVVRDDEGTSTITIKNRPFRLEVIKQAAQGDGSVEPLGGAHFALHREVTVDNVKDMELTPLVGYEDLVSAAETGIVPSADETLAPRTYYLKENTPPSGYQALDQAVKFTISDTGVVTLADHEQAELTQKTEADGTRAYTIAITDQPAEVSVHIIKVDQERAALEDATFTLSGDGIETQTGLVSTIEAGGTDAVIYDGTLPLGTFALTETDAPSGYNPLSEAVDLVVSNTSTGMVVSSDTLGSNDIHYDVTTGVWTIEVMNTAGAVLPNSGGRGTLPHYVVGLALVLCSVALAVRSLRRGID